MDDHISGQASNIRIVRKVRYLRCVDPVLVVYKRGEHLLVVFPIEPAAVLDRLWMMHLETDVGSSHHILLATELRDVEIRHIIELLLGDGLLAELVALSDAWSLHGILVVVVVVLVANADLLMVVAICCLTLLVTDDRYTVDAGDAALTVEHGAAVVEARTLLLIFKVLAVMKVEFLLWVKCVQILEVCWIKSILKTLFKIAYDVEILVVLTELLWPIGSDWELPPIILLVVKVDDL